MAFPVVPEPAEGEDVHLARPPGTICDAPALSPPPSRWVEAAAWSADDWKCVVVHPGNAHHGECPRIRVRGKERVVCWRSLFFFRISGRFRQRVLAFVEWKWFDRFILFLIALNSIFMALYDQRASRDAPFNSFVVRVTEPIFLVFFTVELVLKVIAWGFFLDQRTYLRDPWNWLDFIVVVSAWIETLGLVENGLGFLRLFRILRPLRSLNAVPQMKVLVNTVISSVPRLFNVVGVTVVLFMIFGSIGTSLFGGIFFRGCRTLPAPVLVQNPEDNTTQCWSWPYTSTCDGYCADDALSDEASCTAAGAVWHQTGCESDRLCGGAYMCEATEGYCGGSEDDRNWRLRPKFPGPADTSEDFERGVSGCAPGLPEAEPCTNRRGIPWCSGSETRYIYPETEFINFDHIGGAILTIFQSMTLEGWTDVMYYVQDAYGFWTGALYFFALLPLTSFFLLNVALAVVDEAREDAGDFVEEGRSTSQKGSKLELPALPELGSDAAEEEVAEEEKGGLTSSLSVRSASDRLPSPTESDEVGDFMADPEPGEVLWLDCMAVRILQQIAFSEVFVNIVMFFIAGNVIVMMMETYPPILVLQEPLAICEVVFLGVFCLEMVIMLGAMGPKSYVLNPVTCFDGLIVLVSLIQKIVSLTQASSSGGGGSSAFTALRTLRLFRVLNKLASRSLSFRVLLKAMVATGASLRYWALLFLLVLYIFTLMWMTFFATRFHFEDPDSFDAVLESQGQPWCSGEEGNQDCMPRAHFDTFFWAMITIFQVMTGENWNTIMYAGIRSYEAQLRPFIAGLFMFLILFGQILFLSLFLSMLMSKFDQVQDQIASSEKEKVEMRRSKNLSRNNTIASLASRGSSSAKGVKRIHVRPNSGDVANAPAPASSAEEQAQAWEGSLAKIAPEPQADGTWTTSTAEEQRLAKVAPEPQADDAWATSAEEQPPAGEGSPAKVAPEPQADGSTEELPGSSPAAPAGAPTNLDAPQAKPKLWPAGYAWFVLSESNPARRAARRFLDWEVDVHGTQFKVFDNFILLCILFSSIGMAYDTPLNDPNDALTKLVRESDTIFSYIFIFEMSVKLFAMGLVLGPDAYLRSGWNILDGIVVAVSIVGLVNPGTGGFLKTLRILRAFRPLRVISRNENLKVVVQTMFASMPDLLTLIFVTSFFLLIFALFFLSFLSGKFYQCAAPAHLGDEGVKMSADLPEFVTPLCLGTNSTHQACPHGRYLVSELADSQQKVEWIDESLTCQQSLQNSYCPHSSPELVVPWKRPSWDTPICVGRCNPQAQEEDSGLWESRAWLCEADFKSVEELPSACKGANGEAYLGNMTAGERRGRTFVEQMTRELVMPCGGTTTESAAVSCRQAFCPEEVSEVKKAECKGNCETHPHFCWETCSADADSAACKTCRSECEAACQCADFCEPLIKDAALCYEQGGKWVPMLSQNFNNIANSLLTLFEIMSTEGWVDVMYAASDTTGYYLQPRRDANLGMAPFFVVYIFLSFMFLLNLSVGVIVDKFMDLKAEGKSLMLTNAQQKWLASKKKLFARSTFFNLTNLHMLPSRRRSVYDLISNKHFENVIMAAIIVNTIFMTLKVFPSPAGWWEPALEATDGIFAFVFTAEFSLKFFALRSSYWRDPWNRFDFLCVAVSLFGLVLRLVPSLESIGAITSIIRIFRIGRLFRFFEGLNKIFMALVLSIPKLANVLGILLLLLVLFSILGVSLFSTTKPSETFNEHGNFRNVIIAFITLFRASTGEAWNEIMHDLSKSPEDFWREGTWCAPENIFDPQDPKTWQALNSKCLIENANSCTPLREVHVAVFYWVTYTLIITYMVMNLVVAVILEGYEDGKPDLETEVIDQCIVIWKRYDPDQTMVLDFPNAVRFINEVVGAVLDNHACGPDAESQAKKTSWLCEDLGAVKMRYANIWQNVQLTPAGQVSFLQAVKQVLRFTVAVYDAAPGGELFNGLRVEVVREVTNIGWTLQEGLLGIVIEVIPDGDALVHWDHLGERWLSRDDFGSVAALPLHKLFIDMENLEDKVDKRELDRLQHLEHSKTKRILASRSSSSSVFNHIQMDLRTTMCVLKIQRKFRERWQRRLPQQAAPRETER